MDFDTEELIEDFVEESKEHLETLEDDFLTLETMPTESNKDLLGKIFRAIHSVKGGADFLALNKINSLAHKMETILSMMREDELVPKSENIDTLLTGVDILNGMLDDPTASNEVDTEDILQELSDIIYSSKKEEPIIEIPKTKKIVAPVIKSELKVEKVKRPKFKLERKENNEEVEKPKLDRLEVSDDMLIDFIEEAKEHLESLEDDLLALETMPTESNKDLLGKIFRAIHSVKGGAGFLGFTNINNLSHNLETVLSMMRDDKIKPNQDNVDVLLTGVDSLNIMIDDISDSDNLEISNILNDLKAVINGDEIPEKITKREFSEDSLFSFVEDAKENIRSLEDEILKLENAEEVDLTSIKNIITALKLVNDEATPIGITNIQLLTNEMIETFNVIEEKRLAPNQQNTDYLFDALDCLNAMLDDITNCGEIDLQEIFAKLKNTKEYQTPTNMTQVINRKNLNIQLKKPAQVAKSSAQVAKSSAQVAKIKPAQVVRPFTQITKIKPAHIAKKDVVSEVPIKTATKDASIRVKLSVLQELMRLTGELVLVRNSQLLISDNASPEIQAVTTRLNHITTELQETVTQTRMQPIGNILNKFPRILRDLAKKLGKDIKLHINGEEKELDKTVLEGLTDPLTHMIRNCCDHGVETSQERIVLGKPREGNIFIDVVHDAGHIIIKVKDDGRGIDPNFIKPKIVERGWFTEQELSKMSDKEIQSQIMRPGFSTADKVSDISGRGVGMDVVKTSIEELGGFLDFSSTPGVGTTIIMRLPLTLAIIPCLLVKVNNETYAIPQVNVEKTISEYDMDIVDKLEVTGSREVYRLRDKLLPIARLSEILKRKDVFSESVIAEITEKYAEEREVERKLIKKSFELLENENLCYDKTLDFIVITSANTQFGLIIDEVIGVKEVVVKPMHPTLKDYHCYSGATVMGDGEVALILNVDGLVEHANIKEVQDDDFDKNKTVVDEDKQELLLFKNGEKEQFGIALPLIRRIEYITKEQIESIGDKDFVTIGEETIQIIILDKYLKVSEHLSYDDVFLIIPKHTKKNIGFLATSIIDTTAVSVKLDTSIYTDFGVLGTSLINNKLTLFLDIFALVEKVTHKSSGSQKIDETGTFKIVEASSIRVLFAEDNKFFQKLVLGYLEGGGYEVTTANNGQEALDYFNREEFDVIVSDLEMPLMDGFDFMKNIRDMNQDIPSLALTGAKSEETLTDAYHAGFTRFSIKIDKYELLEKLDSIVNNNNNQAFLSDFNLEGNF